MGVAELLPCSTPWPVLSSSIFLYKRISLPFSDLFFLLSSYHFLSFIFCCICFGLIDLVFFFTAIDCTCFLSDLVKVGVSKYPCNRKLAFVS
jgi:hypothetical protein